MRDYDDTVSESMIKYHNAESGWIMHLRDDDKQINLKATIVYPNHTRRFRMHDLRLDLQSVDRAAPTTAETRRMNARRGNRVVSPFCLFFSPTHPAE